MSSPVRNREVRYVDEFLAAAKAVKSEVPEWNEGSRPREAEARWHIQEGNGFERAHLCFKCSASRRLFPSVSLIFKGEAVWRVDIVPETECKPNPIWARHVGAPARVCGPHEHAWPDNREQILLGDTWGIGCRRPLPPSVRRLPQVLPWFAERLNLDLRGDWRSFDIPLPTDLFQ